MLALWAMLGVPALGVTVAESVGERGPVELVFMSLFFLAVTAGPLALHIWWARMHPITPPHPLEMAVRPGVIGS